MPTQYSPNNPLDVGLLGGFRGYQRDVQQQQTFNTSMAKAQQELFAKSLEIQDFIDGQKARSTERRVKTKKLESEERMLPEQEATDKLTMQAQRAQTKLALATAQSEERARPLFRISASNYDEMIGTIPEDLKRELGLTGNSWAEDGSTILQARRIAIDSAAHMRAIELQNLKNEGRSSGSLGKVKAKAIDLSKKNLMVVDQLLKNDDIYSSLGSDDLASYRSNISAVAQELYQQNVDQVRNGQRGDLVPFATYVTQVKQLADTFTSNSDGFIDSMFNRGSFNASGFNAEVAKQFGVNVNPEFVDALSQDAESPKMNDIGEMETVPQATRKAVEAAATTISQARAQYNIPDGISDVAIFNRYVSMGVLNKDGSLVEAASTNNARSSNKRRAVARTNQVDFGMEPIESSRLERRNTRPKRSTANEPKISETNNEITITSEKGTKKFSNPFKNKSPNYPTITTADGENKTIRDLKALRDYIYNGSVYVRNQLIDYANSPSDTKTEEDFKAIISYLMAAELGKI